MFVTYSPCSEPGVYLVTDEIQRYLGKAQSSQLYLILGEIAFTEEDGTTFYEVDKDKLNTCLFK